jgi:hypothetical protein
MDSEQQQSKTGTYVITALFAYGVIGAGLGAMSLLHWSSYGVQTNDPAALIPLKPTALACQAIDPKLYWESFLEQTTGFVQSDCYYSAAVAEQSKATCELMTERQHWYFKPGLTKAKCVHDVEYAQAAKKHSLITKEDVHKISKLTLVSGSRTEWKFSITASGPRTIPYDCEYTAYGPTGKELVQEVIHYPILFHSGTNTTNQYITIYGNHLTPKAPASMYLETIELELFCEPAGNVPEEDEKKVTRVAKYKERVQLVEKD